MGWAQAESSADPPLYDAALQALLSGEEQLAAARLWQIVGADPNHAGAWLDLGLLYCDQGMGAAAARIFDHVESRFRPSEGIRQLIGQVRDRGCRKPEPPRPFWLRGGLRAGYDSNPNFGLAAESLTLQIDGIPTPVLLSETVRPRPSAWASASLQGEYALSGTWRLHGAASLADYRIDGAYDQGRLLAAVSHTGARGQTSLWASHLWLGGVTYQSTAGLRHRRLLAGPWEADLSLQRAWYPGRTPLDGWLVEPRLGLRLGLPREGQILLSAGPQADLPVADRPGGRRTGVAGQLELVLPLSPAWRLEAFGRLQRLDDASPYSPLFGDTRRNQTLGIGWLALTRAFGPATRCGLHQQMLSSRDAVPLFRYEQRLTSLGCEHEF